MIDDIENKAINRTINSLLVIQLAWISVFYSFSFSWFVSGFVIFIWPILQLLAILYFSIKEKRNILLPYAILPLIFFCYMIIMHLSNGDIWIHGANDFFLLFFCLTCLIKLDKESFIERFYLFCKTMLIVGLSVAIASYLLFLIPENIGEYNLPTFLSTTMQNWHHYTLYDRYPGVQTQPNTTGNWVAYGLIFGVGTYLLKPERRFNLVLLLATFILNIKLFIDGSSRSAMLVALVAFASFILAFVLTLRHKLSRRQNIVLTIATILIVVLLALCLILFFNYYPFRAFISDVLRVSHSPDDTLEDIINSFNYEFDDATGRSELRELTMEAWKEHKIFGISTIELMTHLPSSIWISSGSHNTYIQILATLGLVGLFMFLAFTIPSMVFIVKAVLKEKDKDLAIIATFSLVTAIAMAVGNLYENYMYTSNAIMTLCAYFVVTSGYQMRSLDRER